MRAAMYHSNSDVRLVEMPVPVIGDGELLVKVVACGICGSDVMEWYRKAKAPLVLGHEIAGVIEKAGNGVVKYKAGQRVFVSHHVPCNTCRYCLAGHHTVCHTLRTTNFDPGGFAEFLRVPRINVDRGVFALPDDVTDDQSVFIEPLACVLRGLRLARLRPGQSVLVVGSGIAGLLFIQAARALGAGRIVAADIQESRLDAAKRFGADASINAGGDVASELRRVNGGPADFVVVATGAPQAIAQALRSIEWGGTVLLFAPTNPGTEIAVPFNDLWRNEVTLVSSYGGAPADITEAIALLRAKRVRAEEMITHRLPLAETGRGFRMVADGKESIKVVIEPQR